MGQTNKKSEFEIKGTILDMKDKVPIEYANIVLFQSSDQKQITGTVTTKEGKFSLTDIPSGTYYLQISFIGYEKKIFDSIIISETKSILDLGDIFIESAPLNLNNVIVTGQRSPVSYQIDKQVIDVSQITTTISGTAADVLENVPSVTVDIDGNVSLRGSSSFIVLIDGRPSVMDVQDILQQIPSSTIERIEIITNPSAKYSAEGTSGIINIILKKQVESGLNGVVNVSAGLNDKYGGDFLFEYKNDIIKYNFSVDYNKRYSPGRSKGERTFNLSNSTSYINSSGNNSHERLSYGIRGGIEFNISDKDVLSFGGRFGDRKSWENSTDDFIRWTTLSTTRQNSLSTETGERKGFAYAVNMNYAHNFTQKDHLLTAEFFVGHHTSEEISSTVEFENSVQIYGKKTTEDGPETEFEGKLDYSLPLGESLKFEAGSEGQMEINRETANLYEYNPTTKDYDFQAAFSNPTKSNMTELSLYSIFSNEFGNLGIQAGVRGELTYRTIELINQNRSFSINRWDVFPSIHGSFRFNESSQIMSSYTRRIERPDGWWLEPFDTWIDANNLRRGNPDLMPVLIDSYELGMQTLIGEITLSDIVYYRVSNNKIEGVRSVYSDNVILNTYANVGTDYSLGTEFSVYADPLEFWNTNIMGNVFDYTIKGNMFGASFERKSFNWNLRWNNSFNIFEGTQFQINTRYNSASVSSQGKTEPFVTLDFAARQEIIQRKLTLILQIRDLFKTGKRESTSRGVDFYNYSFYTREAPMVLLNLKYNFNDKKQEDDEENGRPNNSSNDEEPF